QRLPQRRTRLVDLAKVSEKREPEHREHEEYRLMPPGPVRQQLLAPPPECGGKHGQEREMDREPHRSRYRFPVGGHDRYEPEPDRQCPDPSPGTQRTRPGMLRFVSADRRRRSAIDQPGLLPGGEFAFDPSAATLLPAQMSGKSCSANPQPASAFDCARL